MTFWHIESTEHPASGSFEEVPEPFQFPATELLEAIVHLRELDADQRPLDLTQLWETGSDYEVAQALDQIYAVA